MIWASKVVFWMREMDSDIGIKDDRGENTGGR